MKAWIEKIKPFKGQLLLTLILLLAVGIYPFEDHYRRTFTAADTYLVGDAENYVTEIYGDEEDETLRTALVVEEGQEFQGVLAETEPVTLQKGTYQVQVVALAGGPGSSLEVYANDWQNGDNTAGRTLESMELSTEGEMTTFTFAIEESMENVQFRLSYGGEGAFNFSNLLVTSTDPLYNDIPVLLCLISLVSLGIFIWRVTGHRLSSEDGRAVGILLAAVGLACLPLTFDYLLNGHDLYYQFNRILGIQEALKEGQFPVKIHSSLLHGYGYGSSIFYPELFLYFPAVLGLLGMSLINCYKLLLVGIHLATGLISYYSFCRISRSKRIGLLAAVFYVLSVYRLIDLYTRAALGEALAMTFFPLILVGMYELFYGEEKKWYLAVLGFTGVFQSHIISTELMLGVAVLFAVCSIWKLKEKGRLQRVLLAGGTTVLLNLGVLIPILDHMRYPFKVFRTTETVSDWTATLAKIFDFSLAGAAAYGVPGMNNSGVMPMGIGFVLSAGLLIFLLAFSYKKKREYIWRLGAGTAMLAVLCLYLSSNYFPWERLENLPLIGNMVSAIQFAWRFLAVASPLLSLVAAIGFAEAAEEAGMKKIMCGGGLLLAFLCASIYLNGYCEDSEKRYTMENMYQQNQSQVDLLYFIDMDHANPHRVWMRDNVCIPSEGVSVSASMREGLTAAFTYERETDVAGAYVEVPLLYYPNYHAYLEDGTELLVEAGENSVVKVLLPEAETGSVQVAYEEPVLYHVGRGISAVTFFALAAGIFLPKRKKKEYNRKKA